jgi:hypothetical protein
MKRIFIYIILFMVLLAGCTKHQCVCHDNYDSREKYMVNCDNLPCGMLSDERFVECHEK